MFIFSSCLTEKKWKQVLYLFPIYHFVLSHSTHAQSTFAQQHVAKTSTMLPQRPAPY